MHGGLETAPLPAVDRVAGVTPALAHFLEHASLRPGDRLPTEREVTRPFAVGRSTARAVPRRFQARRAVRARGRTTAILDVVDEDIGATSP